MLPDGSTAPLKGGQSELRRAVSTQYTPDFEYIHLPAQDKLLR